MTERQPSRARLSRFVDTTQQMLFDKGLELLYENPRYFAHKFDGGHPIVARYVEIPYGYVVDGTDFPEWRSIRAIVVPFRPEAGEHPQALRAQLEAAELKEKYGPNLLFITVKAGEDYPYTWSSGPVLRKDLGREISTLKKEAKAAAKSDNEELPGMKLRAILAQIFWDQRDQAPSWEEIFINPLKTPQK